MPTEYIIQIAQRISRKSNFQFVSVENVFHWKMCDFAEGFIYTLNDGAASFTSEQAFGSMPHCWRGIWTDCPLFYWIFQLVVYILFTEIFFNLKLCNQNWRLWLYLSFRPVFLLHSILLHYFLLLHSILLHYVLLLHSILLLFIASLALCPCVVLYCVCDDYGNIIQRIFQIRSNVLFQHRA